MIVSLRATGSSEQNKPYGERWTKTRTAQRRHLAALDPSDRAAALLERYPDLRLLPGCDWERLSVATVFGLLFGAASDHFANVQLAALAAIVSTTGVSRAYLVDADRYVRIILNLLQERFGIKTPREITVDMWETWGRDTALMRRLTQPISRYAAAVNYHTPAYVEQLSHEEHARIRHLLLPPLPVHFRERFVPTAEHRAAQRRRRKAKTDVLSECATAILALMLARYPSAERFVRWYRAQIAQIEAGELAIPAHLVYEDEQLDLPHQPGPDAVSVEQLEWRKEPVRLELTIWRPYEFSYRRYTDWMNQTKKGSKSYDIAWLARYNLQRRAKEPTKIYADPHAYFVEADLGQNMPWFMVPAERWFHGLGSGRNGKTALDGRNGASHAGLGTPDDWLARYFGDHLRSDHRHGRYSSEGKVWFEPEAMYRGALFGSAIVILMLTASTRSHEVLQISADRFVTPVRVYVVKNADGTAKRDPVTKQLVTDVIVQQRLLPKGRKHDDLRLEYDVSAARVQLQEITRLLKAAHDGQIPVVRYDPFHAKSEYLGSERYLFQWHGRHLRESMVNGLIRFVLDGIELVDRAGARIDVTSHLLRHAAATVQHHQYGVPLDVLAQAMGHTLTATGEAPEATRYYSQMTEEQKAGVRHDTVMAMMDDARLVVRVIDPETEAERIERLTAEADERTREVLERYGGLHPVTFGHCGYPGLCVRGTARSFCLGCPFLVRRPEYLDRVDFLLEGYLSAADAHERMGDLAGARERKRLIGELRQLKSEMLLFAEAERAGNWTPAWKDTPSLATREA